MCKKSQFEHGPVNGCRIRVIEAVGVKKLGKASKRATTCSHALGDKCCGEPSCTPCRNVLQFVGELLVK